MKNTTGSHTLHRHCRIVGQVRLRQRKMSLMLATGAIAGMLAACSPQIDYHGHVFTETEVSQITPGMSQDQVRLALGTPDTTTTVGGGAYYYISSTKQTVAFMKPTVVDRRVVAVYFDQAGTVQQVANYGLKDGKVFDFITRETPSHGRDASILQQLFRNLGKGSLPGATGADPSGI